MASGSRTSILCGQHGRFRVPVPVIRKVSEKYEMEKSLSETKSLAWNYQRHSGMHLADFSTLLHCRIVSDEDGSTH